MSAYVRLTHSKPMSSESDIRKVYLDVQIVVDLDDATKEVKILHEAGKLPHVSYPVQSWVAI